MMKRQATLTPKAQPKRTRTQVRTQVRAGKPIYPRDRLEGIRDWLIPEVIADYRPSVG